MNKFRSVALAPDRLAPLLPLLFALLLFAGLAVRANLLPLKPMRLEIPSGAETGAAPEESVPPPSATISFTPPTPVLPQESVPSEVAPAEPSPSVAMAPPSLDVPAAGAAGAAVSPLLGLSGSGNLNLRSNRTHAVSVLVANLMQTIQHLRARSSARPVRHPLALTPLPRSSKEPMLVKQSPWPAGLGGAAPRRGDLGGPAPLARRFAPAINGASFKRKF